MSVLWTWECGELYANFAELWSVVQLCFLVSREQQIEFSRARLTCSSRNPVVRSRVERLNNATLVGVPASHRDDVMAVSIKAAIDLQEHCCLFSARVLVTQEMMDLRGSFQIIGSPKVPLNDHVQDFE